MKGTIVENSLSDTSILKEVKILKTWKDGSWILHSVIASPEIISEMPRYLADGPWYIHFWQEGTDDILVVFKNKLFSIKYSDQNTWKDAVEYGKSIGIPEKQLDFIVEQ